MILVLLRLLTGTALLPARVGWRAGRVLGLRRLALVGVGVGIGLLVAPTTGRELRRRLRHEWEQRQDAPRADLDEPGTVTLP